MIAFPLIPPASPTTSDIKLIEQNVVGENKSPFTGSQQIFEYPGEWWEAQCSLPPMVTADADAWTSFLSALRGKSGSFLLGDPAKQVPRGVIANYNMTRFPAAFDNAAWGKNQCSVTGVNTIADPISVVDADVVTPNGGATDAYVVQSTIQAAPGRTYTASVWLKVPSGTKTILIFAEATDVNGALRLAVPKTCLLTTAWQQFSQSVTLLSTDAGVGIQIGGANSWTAGDIHMWLGSVSLIANPNQDFGGGAAVLGAGQTGKTLAIDGIGPNVSGVFLPGDGIQVGVGAAQRLYKNLTTVNSDSGGHATLDLFPRLRESPVDRTPIIWLSPKGAFRLSDNARQWSIDNAMLHGISFNAKEAF